MQAFLAPPYFSHRQFSFLSTEVSSVPKEDKEKCLLQLLHSKLLGQFWPNLRYLILYCDGENKARIYWTDLDSGDEMFFDPHLWDIKVVGYHCVAGLPLGAFTLLINTRSLFAV